VKYPKSKNSLFFIDSKLSKNEDVVGPGIHSQIEQYIVVQIGMKEKIMKIIINITIFLQSGFRNCLSVI